MRKKGKLYTANKWNTPLFMPQRHLFDGISGSSQIQTFDYKATIPDKIEIDTSRMPEQPAPYQSSSNEGGFNWGNFGKGAAGFASMIPENKFTIEDKTFKRGAWDAADPMYYVFDSKGRESQAGNTLSELGVQVTKNSLASGQWWGALAGAGLKVAGDIDNYVAGTKTDEDTLNTLNNTTYALKNFNSEAGSYEGLVRPSGMINYQDVYEGPGKKQENVAKGLGIAAGVLTGIPGVGTLLGKAFAKRSKKAREEAENKNRELERDFNLAQDWAENSYLNNVYNIQQDQMNNLLRNYSAYGGPLDTMPIYDDGMAAINYGFMTDYLNTKKKQAEQKDNNITNLFAGAPSTMFVSGGKIHINPKNKGKFNATKKRTGKTTEELTHSKNPLTRRRAIFAQNAAKWHHADGGPLFLDDAPLFAFGGDLQSHGSDFPTGLTHIDEGGSHEMNPNQGVQMGVDPQGVPNLVEEGEVVYNDYVYSVRIPIDDATKEHFHISKKKDMTYAELAKLLEKKNEITEKPNDPIAQAGFESQMQQLADDQERQKAEMEAERARQAFEALSPEEQTAIMQRAAQEQQVAQEGAAQQQMQQVPTEQKVLAQQQMADGSEAQVAPIQAACGGKINRFDDGGPKLNPYAYSKAWDGFDYFNPETEVYDQGYLDFANAINQDWVNRILAGQYGSMDRYLAANNGIAITPAQVAALATDKKYSDMHKAMASAYKEYLEGIDPVTGEKKTESTSTPDRETQVYIATDKGIIPVDLSTLDDSYTIEDFDGVRIARKASKAPTNTEIPKEEPVTEEESGVKPDLKRETYYGLFGPMTNLGLMSAGVGRPNYRELNATLASARTAPVRAGYATIGDRLTYRPMDIWAEQNRLDAATRAADRALRAGNSPSRYAGILANNYNAQLASGELYRKALEYNDAKKAQVAEFNRGTNQYNADAFTRNSQFNAEAANRANQFATSVALNVAQQKLMNDADWYNSLYGNINGVFDRLNQWEKWKRDHNTVAKMAADGIFGTMSDNTNIGKGFIESKGGKLKKKRKNDLTL